MIVRTVLALCLLGSFLARPVPVSAQAVPAAAASRVPELLRGTYNSPDRAIRRDVPLTNVIRRAFEAGTRDFTGRPGPNYWQLEADYTIEARLDPATHTITGSGTIDMHNNSTIEMSEIVLRLDHNILRGLVPRGSSVPAENTEGIVVTRLLLIRLVQHATICSVRGCALRFQRTCASSSGNSPVTKPVKTTWRRVAGRKASHVLVAGTGGAIGS